MSICCVLGFVLSFRSIFVGVLLAPTVFRVVSALYTIPTFNRVLVLVLVPCCVASIFTVCFNLFCQDTIRNFSPARFNCTCFSRSSGNKSFQGPSGCPPQDCARFLEHLVDHSSVSRDLPSFRWHPSTQAASLAMATESPSRNFALVPLCTGPTFCATCASSRRHGHLLLTSQRRREG